MTTKSKSAKEFDFKSIKLFEDACRHQGIDPIKCIPDVSMLPVDMQKAVIAYIKLVIIFKAINNGWVPDWNNSNQYKYFPWYWVLSSGFGFDHSRYDCTNTLTYSGSRLCTDTSEKALYIAKQFETEYKELFLYEK